MGLFKVEKLDRLKIELMSGEEYYALNQDVSIDKATSMVAFTTEEGRVWVPFTNVKKVTMLSKKGEENTAVKAVAKEQEIKAKKALAEAQIEEGL
ncbi:MAG: hypothetical protein PHW96_01130 [Candidatus Nanoarchaeia archaeon]|nr:hypothetical protein [Candidatus Nanoarchaeia archaeon]